MENRENKVTLLIGDRGEGKTKTYIEEVIPSYVAKGYKKSDIHVFMVQPNKWYTNKFNSGIEQKVTIHYITDIKEGEKIITKLHNGVILFEDAQTIFGDRLDKDTRRMIINTRMTNVDTYIIYHSWGLVNKDIMRFADVFVCFRIHEDPKVRSEFLTGLEMEEIRKGQKEIQRGIIKKGDYYIIER